MKPQTATYQTLTGPMTETPAGGPTYTATVPSPPATGLYPIHGPTFTGTYTVSSAQVITNS